MKGTTIQMQAKKRVYLKLNTAAVCAMLLVLTMTFGMLLTGCSDDGEAAQTTEAATAPETTVTSTETSAPETTETTTPAPETSAPETSASETAPAGGSDTQPVITNSPLANYNPPADRNTDFSGCLFIGDSRTQGLILYSGIYGAENYTARGLTVDSYFTAAAVDMNGSKVSVSQAVEAGPDFERVYIMLGINELGWAYTDVFIERYGKLIDHVKANMPDAKIIVQSILPITPSRSASDAVFNNANVTKFNALIKDMCAGRGVTYFDLTPHMGDENGALPEGAAFDGIHLQKPYCQKWLDVLKANMN